MAKGVKKIKVTKGTYYPKMSVDGHRVTIQPNQDVIFQVSEWMPNTAAEDKKKPVIWMIQSKARKIIYQLPSSTGYKFNIPKQLCGSYQYYIEASLSGFRDMKNDTGLHVKGWCDPKIVSSRWTTQRGSKVSIKNTNKDHFISYGHIIYLNLITEGLNGNKLIMELWNHQKAKDDKQICVYTDVNVVEGEVNLKISNTYSWMSFVDNIQKVEEFYIKVKDTASNKYIKDNLGDELHAIYLNVKNKVATTNVNISTNQTPTKVYKPDVSTDRYEPCKFEKIKITESQVKDGKAENTTVTIFDNGKGLKQTGVPHEKITRTIHYKFDSTIIDKDGVDVLNNILKFLLEHKGSTINLSGYACVIGKQNYNKGLSQRRADVVKKFFGDGGLDLTRIISLGKGEVDPSDDKMGSDNIKYKDEKNYENNRRVDISFTFQAHDAQTVVYEVVAPSISTKKLLTIDVNGFNTKACFRGNGKHKKEIYVVDVGQAIDKGDIKQTFTSPSFNYGIYSDISRFNAFPLQYIWPNNTNPNQFHLHVHSCRYFSNEKRTTVLIKAYPDVKWTLEFKWNHTQPFAYSYGNKLHPHDLKTGKQKVIGSEVDRGWSKNFGEMAQSFELSLAAEWDKKSQKAELGKEFGEKIAKTLGIFNKIKSMTEKVSNSPLTKGKVMFEIKSPVIALSAEWYLQRALPTSPNITTIVEVGVSAKPLVEASFTINLFKIFVETLGNGVCPGAGEVIRWVMEKFEGNAGIHFLVIFAGGIYVDGKTTINISYPKETTGEVKATGKIQVTIEFKAWAKGGVASLSVEGIVKADIATSVKGGIKVGADKKGIYASPVAEFGGIVAKFVATGTVKFGVYKRSLEYEAPPCVLVKEDSIEFNKYYLNV